MSNPNHSSKDGRFVSKEFTKENKDTTVTIGEKQKVKTSRNFDKDLRDASEGLSILSESDYPLETMVDANIRVSSLDKFFASQIMQQPELEGRFLQVKSLLQKNLDDSIVMVIGEEPLKRVIIVGKDDKGNYRGLISFVVET